MAAKGLGIGMPSMSDLAGNIGFGGPTGISAGGGGVAPGPNAPGGDSPDPRQPAQPAAVATAPPAVAASEPAVDPVVDTYALAMPQIPGGLLNSAPAAGSAGYLNRYAGLNDAFRLKPRTFQIPR